MNSPCPLATSHTTRPLQNTALWSRSAPSRREPPHGPSVTGRLCQEAAASLLGLDSPSDLPPRIFPVILRWPLPPLPASKRASEISDTREDLRKLPELSSLLLVWKESFQFAPQALYDAPASGEESRRPEHWLAPVPSALS